MLGGAPLKSVRLFAALVAALIAFLSFAPAPTAFGATYGVDTIADDGPAPTMTACTPAALDCSLRGALSNASASSSADTISFDGAIANQTITINSALTLAGAGGDTIDGIGTGVIIDAIGESATFDCLDLDSPNNTVQGLQFTDCLRAIDMSQPASDNNTIGPGNTMFDNSFGVAIRTSDATSNVIIGNKIGTNQAGTASGPEVGNLLNGILIEGASGNLIGGSDASRRNIVSGNVVGIRIHGPIATGNEIYGNFVGVDVTGTVDLGNAAEGVSITGGATGNTIGGIGSRANVISGNTSHNISILSGASNINVIAGNIIGPDVNGSGVAMSNGAGGVSIAEGSGNVIGPGNLISDHTSTGGILISGPSTSGTVVRGNRIGTNLTGTAGVPNSRGVSIAGSAQLSTVGGVNSGEGNVIAFNSLEGIKIDGATTTGNSIRANSIHTNGGPEIDNVAGGNTEPFAPSLLATNGFSVNGITCPNCIIDLFSDSATDAHFYEGSVTATSDGTFVLVKTSPLVGPNLTATSTNGSGNSSELSAALVIDSDGDGADDVSDADDDNDGIADVNDGCRIVDEDYDSYQDADGCPEPDNDLDGICDAGQASFSCTGSDSGKSAFFAAGHGHTNPTIDCRNVPEDTDAFKDSDGCPEPDNDNDGFPDATDDCPGTDDVAGPDGVLGSGEDQNHNGILNGGEDQSPFDGVLTTDDVVLTFEDYDLILNTDGCHDSPGDDRDGDGYQDEVEALHIGTRADDPCGTDGWPSDIVSTGFSLNRFDIVDLGSFVAPPRRLGTSPGPGSNFNVRWDLKPGPITPTGAHINIQDLAITVAVGDPGFPPMFGSQRAFNRTCVVAP